MADLTLSLALVDSVSGYVAILIYCLMFLSWFFRAVSLTLFSLFSFSYDFLKIWQIIGMNLNIGK